MMISEIASFLACCTAINIAFLAASSLLLSAAGPRVARFHARLFGIPTKEVRSQYFQYLAQYKLLILVFNLVPYLALSLIAATR